MSRAEAPRRERKKAAGCMVMARKTGRFLFCRRPETAPAGGKWSLWAGKAEKGENPAETAGRELFEETGIQLAEFPDHVHRMSTKAFQFDTFCAVVDEEFIPKSTPESDGYAWAPIEAVPHPTHWGLEKLLKDRRALSILGRLVEKESGRPCAPKPRVNKDSRRQPRRRPTRKI